MYGIARRFPLQMLLRFCEDLIKLIDTLHCVDIQIKMFAVIYFQLLLFFKVITFGVLPKMLQQTKKL